MSQAGFLVIDKPPGITSHDVVATIRAVLGIKKVGHTGTLDPFATGVLPVAIGRCTRLIQFLDERSKVYEATISLGTSMDTGDPTGAVIDTQPVPVLTEARLAEVLASFEGDRMQRPPAYSAVKVNGKRLYKYAREGTLVKAEPRPIHIQTMALTGFTERTIDVNITCSRGTYVRVIAEEVAEALGTAGHLGVLRRAASGSFALEHALGFDELSRLVAGRKDWPAVLRPARGEERVEWAARDEVWEKLQAWMRPPAEVLSHLPAVDMTLAQRDLLQRRGAGPSAPEGVEPGGLFLARYEAALIAVLRREEIGISVARMFALG